MSILDLIIAYFKSRPESLLYPGMDDEEKLHDLLDAMEKLAPKEVEEIRAMIR